MRLWLFRRRRPPVGGSELGVKLAKALGLDPNKVRRITLDVGAGSAAQAVVTVYIDTVQGTKVVDVVRRYLIETRTQYTTGLRPVPDTREVDPDKPPV